MNKTIWIIVGVVIIAAGIYYFAKGGSSTYTPTINQTPATTQTTTPPTDSTPTSSDITSKIVAISIQNFAFNPSTITVAKGATVVWTNHDSVDHKIASDTGAFGSGNLANGLPYSFKFNTPGTYTYHCAIHPTMTGTIIVK